MKLRAAWVSVGQPFSQLTAFHMTFEKSPDFLC
jgi:hypothetical protein